MGGMGTVEPAADRETGRRAERAEPAEKADRGPRVCGLASARDRARLREGYAAERVRVEQALARGPVGREVDDEWAPRMSARSAPAPVSAVAGPVPSRAADCICRACGGSDVAIDFVRERGTWRLARCGRCDFIWTERSTERSKERMDERPLDRGGVRFAPRTRRSAEPVQAAAPRRASGS